MHNSVNLEIMSFLEQQILPRYNAFGHSHGLKHVLRVIKNSLELARIVGADQNMAYVIAAYHDLGMEGPRAIHHLTGGKILASDARLKKWFTSEQIKIMKEAVEDHRASSSRTPRSIYGKIVADADRNNSVYLFFSRPIKYGLKNEPKDWTKQQHLDRVYNFVQDKFGRNGYVKYWLDIDDTKKEQQAVWDLLDNKDLCYSYMSGLFDEITKGTKK